MEHVYFFLLNFLVFVLIVAQGRKNWKDYALLGVFAMILDLIFEIIPVAAGVWSYHSKPIIFGLSLYTWLLYVPYLGFCYFSANRVLKNE